MIVPVKRALLKLLSNLAKTLDFSEFVDSGEEVSKNLIVHLLEPLLKFWIRLLFFGCVSIALCYPGKEAGP